jgi:hypothetical protein
LPARVGRSGLPHPLKDTAGPTYLEAVMRMMLKAVVDTEAGNEGLRSAPEALDRLHEFLKPEAFYGVAEDGQRAFIAVFDLADPSQIPVVCEPIYRLTKGKITITPCMSFEDVKKGVSEAAAQMQAMQGESAQ